MRKNLNRRRYAHRLGAVLVAWPMLAAAGGAATAIPPASVIEIMQRDLAADAGKEVVMLTVAYPAAGASLPHRHDAQVFVYVLKGELTMQVRGSPAVTLRAGQAFYEAPDDVHVVSANASRSLPARILVVMIKDKNKPASRDVAD